MQQSRTLFFSFEKVISKCWKAIFAQLEHVHCGAIGLMSSAALPKLDYTSYYLCYKFLFLSTVHRYLHQAVLKKLIFYAVSPTLAIYTWIAIAFAFLPDEIIELTGPGCHRDGKCSIYRLIVSFLKGNPVLTAYKYTQRRTKFRSNSATC